MFKNLSPKEIYTNLKNINYWEHIKSLVFILFLAFSFRSFVIEPYSIPSGSMRPSLLEGDYLFSYKFSYGFSRYSFPFGPNLFEGRVLKQEPQRGDVVIFRGTKDTRTYIKRLIGLPNDKIKLVNKVLYINGQKVARVYIGKYDDYTMCAADATACNMYRETLPNGTSYTILEANHDNSPEFTVTTKEYVVPYGHYFFMGDNRNNSIDSRFLEREVGIVPEENLIAKAKFLVFTFDLSKLVSGRFFQVL